MSDFQTAITILLKHEGGYNPSDNLRGAANFGITQKTYDELKYPARVSGWPVAVRDLTKEQAKLFYYEQFWTANRCGAIEDPKLATLFFSLGVNCGLGRAARWLQEAVGVTVDGRIGAQTLASANSLNPTTTLANLKDLAWEHYHGLAQAKPKLYGDDLCGWMDRLAELTGDPSIRIPRQA